VRKSKLKLATVSKRAISCKILGTQKLRRNEVGEMSPMIGFDFLFSIFPFFFIVTFIIIIVAIVYQLSSSMKQKRRNDQSPVLTVDASIVSKRTDVTYHHHETDTNHMYHTNSHTWYYVTFQVESGDRMELPVEGADFGILAEGDVGRLTFQGTRFLGFERR